MHNYVFGYYKQNSWTMINPGWGVWENARRCERWLLFRHQSIGVRTPVNCAVLYVCTASPPGLLKCMLGNDGNSPRSIRSTQHCRTPDCFRLLIKCISSLCVLRRPGQPSWKLTDIFTFHTRHTALTRMWWNEYHDNGCLCVRKAKETRVVSFSTHARLMCCPTYITHLMFTSCGHLDMLSVCMLHAQMQCVKRSGYRFY